MGTISAISDGFVDAFAVLDPVEAVSEMGVGLNADTMTDDSPDGDAAMADLYRSTRAALAAATPEDESERLGAGYLDDFCAAGLALIESGERSCLLNELVGPQAAVRQLFDLLEHGSPEEWERVGVRLGKVPAAIDGYRQNLAAGLAAGHRSTVRLTEAVASQCATWAGNDDGGWFGEFVADAADPALDALARNAAAAYGELATWLRQSYAPAASTVDGVGPERYRVWAVAMLGADLDPDESYNWGCAELARSRPTRSSSVTGSCPAPASPPCATCCSPTRTAPYTASTPTGRGSKTSSTRRPRVFRARSSTSPMRCVAATSGSRRWARPRRRAPRRPARTWSGRGARFPTLGKELFPMRADVTTVYHEAVPGHHLRVLAAPTWPRRPAAQRLGFRPCLTARAGRSTPSG